MRRSEFAAVAPPDRRGSGSRNSVHPSFSLLKVEPCSGLIGFSETVGSADLMQTLGTYGDAIGIAFQLSDDALGVSGDPSVTGKGTSEDLSSGKATLLLVRALELAKPADRVALDRCFSQPNLDERELDECREAIGASGVLASVEKLLEAQHSAALAALRGLLDSVVLKLSLLADMLAFRSK
jgi:geranylgeranyl diphosphate synthase, type I